MHIHYSMEINVYCAFTKLSILPVNERQLSKWKESLLLLICTYKNNYIISVLRF